MKLRYRSGEVRDLLYQINGGPTGRISGFNSGSWNTFANMVGSRCVESRTGEYRALFRTRWRKWSRLGLCRLFRIGVPPVDSRLPADFSGMI